jgi:hypothetical protein
MSIWEEQRKLEQKIRRFGLTRRLFVGAIFVLGIALLSFGVWAVAYFPQAMRSALEANEDTNIIATVSPPLSTDYQAGMSPIAHSAFSGANSGSPEFAPNATAPWGMTTVSYPTDNYRATFRPSQRRLPVTHRPLAVKFRGQEHSLVVAAQIASTHDGVATEWSVQPWWRVGWIPTSTDCGVEGTVSMAGHVSWYNRLGPMAELGDMAVGEVIECQSSKGVWHTYQVVDVYQVPYGDVAHYQLSRPGENALVLFSCSPELTGIIIVRAQEQKEIADNG